MILGMSFFTFAHIVISLVGIASGLVIAWGLLNAKRLDRWTVVFLASTVATSVTGFFFPFERFLPSHAVGIISVGVLTLAILVRYHFHLAGGWRRTYVVNAMIALYLNLFVSVAQLFQKIAALQVLAPTQSEPPFLVAQVILMLIFIAVTIAAAIRFQPESVFEPKKRIEPAALQMIDKP